jgi:hypothetical protein
MNDWLTDFLVPVDYTIGNVPTKDTVCSICKQKAAAGDEIFPICKQCNTDTGFSGKIILKPQNRHDDYDDQTITTHPVQITDDDWKKRMLYQFAKRYAKEQV